jgi:hypothetical protein
LIVDLINRKIQMTANGSRFETETVATVPSSRTETAYEWLQRSRRKRALAEVPHDPSSAAWAFVRASNSSAGGGSNIAFLDAVLRRQTSSSSSSSSSGTEQQLPVIDVRGDCCKTWTVVSVASRFAVATRSSQFQTTPASASASVVEQDVSSIPQVIVLDSTHDVTTAKLAYAVRSNLLRQSGSSNPGDFQKDTEECLARIHVATVDNISGWVAVLEALRCKLSPASCSEHPTLVLWDGFLSEPHNEASRMEVIRQLARLVQECSVLLLTTSSGNRKHEWDKFVTHRIRLDCNQSASVDGHEFVATVHGSRIPFSLSLAGILS